jgi:hypothetical protein
MGDDDGEALVREVLSENPAEKRGEREEWKRRQGWHRKEDVHARKDAALEEPEQQHSSTEERVGKLLRQKGGERKARQQIHDSLMERARLLVSKEPPTARAKKHEALQDSDQRAAAAVTAAAAPSAADASAPADTLEDQPPPPRQQQKRRMRGAPGEQRPHHQAVLLPKSDSSFPSEALDRPAPPPLFSPASASAGPFALHICLFVACCCCCCCCFFIIVVPARARRRIAQRLPDCCRRGASAGSCASVVCVELPLVARSKEERSRR